MGNYAKCQGSKNCSKCRECDVIKLAVFGASGNGKDSKKWEEITWKPELHLSEENNKLGKMWNISLAPVISCPEGIPCGICSKGNSPDCYAVKSFIQYPSVFQAWGDNLTFVKQDMQSFFTEIYNVLKTKKNLKYFRWHVAGDILNQEYLAHMAIIANLLPKTQFLAFTKKTELDYSNLPANLVIIASQWGSYQWGNNLPKAILRATGETWELTEKQFLCPGSCVNCKQCFQLLEGESVVFDQH